MTKFPTRCTDQHTGVAMSLTDAFFLVAVSASPLPSPADPICGTISPSLTKMHTFQQ